jgi:hypothetical protein
MERRASSPPISLPETGTPITGRFVFEATTPGRAAAIPAMAMKTFASEVRI